MPVRHIEHFLIQTAEIQAEMRAHLQAEKVPFTERMVSDQGLYQLFLMDPNDVKIELSFGNEEALACGLQPEIKASDLAA